MVRVSGEGKQVEGAAVVGAKLVPAATAARADDMGLTADAVSKGVCRRDQLRRRCAGAGAAQGLGDNFELHLQLLLVVGVLPLAAAAFGNESAWWRYAARRRLQDVDCACLQVVAPAAGDLGAPA